MTNEEYKKIIEDNKIGYQISGIIQKVLLENTPNEMRTQPINQGKWATFYESHIQLEDLHIRTDGEWLILEKEGKQVAECFNPDGLFDWPIAMLIYLKEKDLIDDFRNFYMF